MLLHEYHFYENLHKPTKSVPQINQDKLGEDSYQSVKLKTRQSII